MKSWSHEMPVGTTADDDPVMPTRRDALLAGMMFLTMALAVVVAMTIGIWMAMGYDWGRTLGVAIVALGMQVWRFMWS